MERTVHWTVSVVAIAVAGTVSYLLLGSGLALSAANAVAFGTLGWLSIEHCDLLHRGHQPLSVSRWSGVAAGFSTLVALSVLTIGIPGVSPGQRAAVTVLVFGSTWAGVGLGISLARADAVAKQS